MPATPRAASALSAFSYAVCADQLPSEQQHQCSHERQQHKWYVQPHADTIKECIFLYEEIENLEPKHKRSGGCGIHHI
jgi:hypothetical protein